MWRLLYILAAFLPMLPCSAQQLSFETNKYRYLENGFFSDYDASPSTLVQVKNASFYKSKKVKTIQIFSDKHQLIYSLELDTAGNTLRTGYDRDGFFKVYWSAGENPHYESQACMQDNKVIKTDSSTQTYFKFVNGDTAMEYTQIERKAYVIGFLLNKRNNYYNKSYLHKRFRLRNCEHVKYVNRFGWRWPVRKRVYLKKRLKTNYQSDSLYLANTSFYENWQYASAGRKAIDTSFLKVHPFCRNFRKQDKKTNLVEGEKSIRVRTCYLCSVNPYHNHIYIGEDPPSFERREYTLNPKGLYDEYINLYFPKDTNKVAIEKYREREQAEKNNSNSTTVQLHLSGHSDYSHLYPRLEVPVRTRIYYFRYTFYED